MPFPSISVIIVNWNSREDVLEGIRSLKQQTEPALDIIVVDNGSTDGSVEAIRAQHPDVRVLPMGENLGFAEGCNRGIAEAHSEWLFLLNSDAIASADCIALLRKVAREAPPDVGMIQPCVVFRANPQLVNSSGVVIFRNGTARDRHFGEPVTTTLGPAEVFCSTAGAALYRRSMLEEVRMPSGYFDREFFMYFEDVDLGWRCRLAGWRALYVHEARVLHRFQASSSRRGNAFVEIQCRINRINTLVKNASIRMLASTLPRTFMDLALLTSTQGPSVLWRLASRLPDTLRERRKFRRIRKVGRRAVEGRWMSAVERPPPDLRERSTPPSTQEWMDAGTYQRRAALGAVYLVLRTAVTQLCVLGGTVVLARTLGPADFGVYAILRFALAFFEFFGDAGVGGALVRKQSPPAAEELTSVFSFQCLLAGLVVAIVWLVAPGVELVWTDLPVGSAWLLRAMSVAFLLTAARVAPAIQMEHSLQFGRIAALEVVQTIAFYAVACGLAVAGFGAWALGWATVAQAAIGLVGAFVISPWRARFDLRWDVLRPLVKFGIPYQVKGLIGFVNSAVAPLYAGAALGPVRLGYVNWAQSTAFFPLKLVEVMSRVSFPLFARLQGDPDQLRRSLERGLQVCAFGTFFWIALFTSMGTNVTQVIYTNKWLPGLFALYLYSWTLGIGFISPVVGAALDAIGKPGIIARLAVLWTLLNWLVVPMTTTRWGMNGFVAGNCVHVVVGNLALVAVLTRVLPGIRWPSLLAPPLVGAAGAFVVGWTWARHWAWGGGSLMAAIALLLLVHGGIAALLDRRTISEFVAMLRREPVPASPGHAGDGR